MRAEQKIKSVLALLEPVFKCFRVKDKVMFVVHDIGIHCLNGDFFSNFWGQVGSCSWVDRGLECYRPVDRDLAC